MKDFAVDIISDIFSESIPETKVLLGVFLSIAIFGTLIYVIVYKINSSFKRQKLFDYLYEPLAPDGYFLDEVWECCDYFAHVMMMRQHGSDIELFRTRMSEKIKPLFFKRILDEDDEFDKAYFSSQFADFVMAEWSDAYVSEFQKVARAYVDRMYEFDQSITHISPQFEKKLINDVVNAVMETEEAKQVQLEVQQQQLLETAQAEVTIVEDTREKDELFRRLAVASYNCAIREIKLNNNRGLNPTSFDYCPNVFLMKLCALKVYSQQKVLSLCRESRDTLDCPGCYIVYNTFNSQYFIGKSDRMFSRIYDLLTQVDCKGCSALNRDINSGHLVLVKFVKLADSGYTSLAKLQHDLILSYDCRQDKGYNK